MFETNTLTKLSVSQPKDIGHHFISWTLSILCYLYFFLLAAILLPAFFLLWLVSCLFDRDRQFLHRTSNWLAHRILFISPLIACTFEGLDNLRVNQPCIMVANHQSIIDILVLCGLPANFKWVAKKSIFQIPVLGWIMTMIGYICLVPETLRGRRRMFRESRYWLNRGVSLLIFPEGTRSSNGELLGFKKGPFHLAIASKLPIVPIIIDGTAVILPKYAKRLNLCGHVRVCVLPAVYPEQYCDDAVAFCNNVRAAMAQSLKEMRACLPVDF